MSLLRREIGLALDRGLGWLTAAVVFLSVAALAALGLGGEARDLRAAGPGLAWAAVVVSLMVAAPSLFARDRETGALDQLLLRGHTRTGIVGAKLGSVGLLVLLPVAVLAFAVAQLLFLGGGGAARLVASLLVASPALAAYATFLGAVTSRRGAAALVGVLVLLPLLAPTLIFGVAAVEADAPRLWAAGEFQALAGLSLIGLVVGWAGAVAALGVE